MNKFALFLVEIAGCPVYPTTRALGFYVEVRTWWE